MQDTPEHKYSQDHLDSDRLPNNDLQRLEQLQRNQMDILKEIESIQRKNMRGSAEHHQSNEPEPLDLENIMFSNNNGKSGLDSAKNSKGNYVSLNRNFRGHFNTDDISDNMFDLQNLQNAPSGQNSS